MLKPDIPTDELTRIIVAESNVGERDAYCRRLGDRKEFSVRGASDWPSISALLDDRRYDVVILGSNVGGVSGIEINSTIKSFCEDPPATIMLDGVGSMSAAIKAFRCGFVDYLVKETTGDRALQDAILRATRMVRAERAKVQHIRHFEWLSQRDGITGLANRHHMQDRLEQLVQMGLRHNSQFAAILIRVNEYDYINASFGSIVGDQALHAFSSKLKAVVRKSDTVGRLDKDTFLYLVDRDVTDQSIAGVCGRLAEATRFSMELDTLSVSLSSSVAAAVYPADGATVAELLDAADRVSPYGASNSKTKLAPTKMSPEGTRNLGTSASLDGATAGLAASHNGVVTGERPASQPASNGYGGSNSVASLRTDAGMAHVAAMESANGVQPARMGREQPAASANALEVGARTPDSMVISG